MFLAVGFEPATVDSRELYAPTERRVVKVDIYIHRTKAASYKRHATISKNSYLTKPGIEHLLFLGVGFEPATVRSRSFALRPQQDRWKLIHISMEQRQLPTKDTKPFQNTIVWPDLDSNAYYGLFGGNRTSQCGEQWTLRYNEKMKVKVSIYIHRTKASRQTL